MKILVGVLTTVLVVLYPVGIWLGLTHFSARAVSLFVLVALVPVALLRFRRARREDLFAVLRIPLLVGALVGAGAALDDPRFVLAMPVLINATLLVTFALSLFGTPIIERFARLQEPDGLDERQVAHCRQVTWAWIALFALNAIAAAVLASDEAWIDLWAVYNGGLAYALIGLMFVGEYFVRSYRFRRYGDGLHDRLMRRIFPPRGENT